MIRIRVNDVAIPAAAIAREVQYQEEATPQAAWDAAARALVIRELLLQRAAALGIAAEPLVSGKIRETEEEAIIRSLLEAEVATPKADEAACLKYFQSNPSCFRSSDLFEPLHILFKAARVDEAAYASANARAETVLAQLRDAPERFEDFARTLSDCPSAVEGGRLGQVARGETTPEFEAALLALKPGEICAAPICTPYGAHLIRLERRVPGVLLPFEQVRDDIASYLEAQAQRQAAARYIALLAGEARIEGVEMRGPGTPRPRS